MREHRNWGLAWLALTVTLALHVWDEAVHDFLSVYNPVILQLRERWPFLPLPTFDFTIWITGLATAIVILSLLTPFAFRGRRSLRFVAYPYSVLMLLNGLQHIGTSIYFGRAMPGVLSSPLLLLASVALFVTTRRVSSRAKSRDPVHR